MWDDSQSEVSTAESIMSSSSVTGTGLPRQVPVILMTRIEGQYNEKSWAIDDFVFKLPMSEADRAQLRSILCKKAKNDYEEIKRLPRNCGNAMIIAHFN